MSAASSHSTTTASAAAFGTQFGPRMSLVRFADGVWERPAIRDTEPLALHPATHVLHYASACFEGLKAHRGVDGTVRIFRLDAHVERMRRSADQLMLPVPDASTLAGMIIDTVDANRDLVPDTPGSLYLRPTLIGTEPNIGAAAAPSAEALLFVLASPVGDYFAGGLRPLRLVIETEIPRTTPQFGAVKSGANYAMALGVTQEAKRKLGVDQVLFAPGGDVQETGASNFILLDDARVVTRRLDGSFLHGITRDSVLVLARDHGYEVEERGLTVDEVLAWTRHGEAALTGTAAMLAGVGTILYEGVEHRVGDGDVGPNTRRLREELAQVQVGSAPDRHGWTTAV